ncbi:hypothetical protein AM500_05015 [Bacillus sp. FJAT-18017]|uniref:hypothetical protein n=1 Tax=Bacillus sp. FJAT-18017 TaxID=1705566 RepID=UPI0006AEEA52|nr:hypothetical protein [Bacillus sp. FJAT-18017]ALC89216.1 hypothetical protein AM500_05015 [Bacillus sp. FJAT-18017]
MDSFKEGYRHFVKNSSGFKGVNHSFEYVNQVQREIDKTIAEMSKTVTQRLNANDATTKGFVAEDWHAGTFNADVVAKGGKDIYASVDKSNNPIKDIDIFNKGTSSSWQSKYYKSAEDTAKELSNPKYNNVGKVAPSDQIAEDGIRTAAQKQALRNSETRHEVAEAYQHTANYARSVIEENGYSSRGLSDREALKIVEEIKNGTFDPKKYGLTTEDFVKVEYVIQQSLKAGVTAAALTAIIKVTPEIYKIIMSMIEQGYIEKDQLIQAGFITLDSSVEGFIRGSIAAAITATLKSGLAGETLKSIDPSMISLGTILVMNAIHNSFKVATGRMKPVEFVDACARDLVVSSFALIGGSVSQGLIQIPVFGFMLGSFLGSIVGSFVYDAGKRVCLSFCIESGFTFFGLVKQDYVLPKEVIVSLGLKVFEYERFIFNPPDIKQSEPNKFSYKKFEPNTININILRRGVIGVNKVGFV